MDQLTYIDQRVLNEVYEMGIFRDKFLSEQIGCPRIFLLVRLTNMISTGLISRDGENYALTQDGLDIREPIVIKHIVEEEIPPSSPIFTWENLYVPPKGWDAE